jgi:hypothetical protein
MRSKLPFILLSFSLIACEDVTLAHGLRSTPPQQPTDPRHLGCRLNVQTHVGTCGCATAGDVEDLPDRADLEALDIELDDGVDVSRLARLTHVHTLTLRNAKPEDIPRVATLTRLTSLTMSMDPKTPACDVAPLAQLVSLEHLTLSLGCDHPVDAAPLDALASLKNKTLDAPAPPPGSACR